LAEAFFWQPKSSFLLQKLLFTARRLNGFGHTVTISAVLPKGETHLAHSPGHAPSPPFQVVRLENRIKRLGSSTN